MTSVFMFGATGQLALAMVDATAARGLGLTTLSRSNVDLTDTAAIRDAIAHAPDGSIILNAAAYTAVDKAETERELAAQVNTEAPATMAKAAAERGLGFIHVSTDYVFDGMKASAYAETDTTNPKGVYGQTKLDGEIAVADVHPGAAIVRTSWVYSPFGANFLKTMLRYGVDRDELRVVDDQVGAPTSAHDIAEGLLTLIAAGSNHGVFHLTGSGEASWADFADAIFEHQASVWGRRPTVTRIPTSEYPTPAARPANSRLNCDRFEQVCGYRAPHWRDSMARVLDQINRG